MKVEIKCAHTKVMSIKELKEKMYPGNENSHPKKQIEALGKIIEKNGQRQAIVISKRSGYVTKGHGRILAMAHQGFLEAAVDEQEYEDEMDEMRDRVADNEIARYAEFQLDQFESNIEKLDLDIKQIEFTEFGLLGSKGKRRKKAEISYTCPNCDHNFSVR